MKIENIEEFVILSPEGKLDTISAPEFSEKLTTILDTKPKKCIINLEKITFLSSLGLQALLSGAKTSKKNGTIYGVCGMNDMVKEVFLLSGFDRFIQMFDNQNSALDSL